MIIEIAGLAFKAISAARAAGRLAGHETPALDEAHGALTGARGELVTERAEETGTTLGDAAADGDGGLIDTVLDFFGDLF